jgi:hypothetical protein
MRDGMKRMQWRAAGVIALGLLFMACLPGCGVKSAPIAPEFARPERTLDLHASPDHAGIKLTWERPTRYVGGHTMRDLSGFVILRAEDDAAKEPLVELPVTDQERFSVQHDFSYVDGETVMGHTYRYEVVSKTVDGSVSEPSNEVDFTRITPSPPPNPDTFQLPAPHPPTTSLP